MEQIWQKNILAPMGVRGEVGQSPITPDFVLKLGYAAGQVLVQHDDEHRPTVLIGKDTRISGQYARSCAGGGFYRSRRQRDSNRPAAHAGRGLSHLRALRLAAG